MATRTIAAGGGLWSNGSTWDEGVAPVAGDDVVARGDGTSGNLNINTASACATINLTNYTGTLTYTSTLTTTGTVTYPAGFTMAGTGDHISVTGSTLDIVPTLPGGLRLGGTSQTFTLARNLSMNGTLLFNGTTSTLFSGAFTISAGALSITSAVMAITMSGNITISGNAAMSSATSTTFSGGFTLQAATCTVSGSQTVDITNASVTITGLTTSSTANVFTGGTWTTGGLTITGNTTGTTLFTITSGTVTLTSAFSCSMTFAGNITWASQTNLYAASGTPTLTYSSGTITVGTSVLSVGSSCTIVGMPLFDMIITGAATITINTTRVVGTGTLTLPNAAVTFDGTAAWTFANVTNSAYSATRVTTFKESLEYIITTSLTTEATDTLAEKHTWTSAHATTKTIITLQFGATQNVSWIDPTRIDSSKGQTIYTHRGVITTSFNWANTIESQNILNDGGGESLTIAGITKDNSGNVLVSCDCYLFRDNGNNTPTYLGYVQSHGTTGAYSFTVFAGSTYFVVAFKGGGTPVMDVTDRTLVAV